MKKIRDYYILLIHKHLTHQQTIADARKLNKWLKKSERHRQYYREMKLAWELSGSIEEPPIPDTTEQDIQRLMERIDQLEQTCGT